VNNKKLKQTMLRTGLIALSIAAAPAAMAAENDNDYKAETAIRACAGVIRSQGYSWFRADYDRGKKTVQTNIQPGEQEGVISPFEQCLISQGVFIQLPRR
jgi:hypothetical protein